MSDDSMGANGEKWKPPRYWYGKRGVYPSLVGIGPSSYFERVTSSFALAV